jgi:hypothetical protein
MQSKMFSITPNSMEVYFISANKYGGALIIPILQKHIIKMLPFKNKT